MSRLPVVPLALGALAVGCVMASTPAPAGGDPACPADANRPIVATDQALCAELAPVVADPSALPLDAYEEALSRYLDAFCHRDLDGGWIRDSQVRDTGPFVATLAGGKWTGKAYATHAPVVIYYSPSMAAWLRVNRPADEASAPADPPPVPDGAMIIKEMYPPPASSCRDVPLDNLLPTADGAAIMVRDSDGSWDGWFWGWYGWEGWSVDWPPVNSRYPHMGFGSYCVNCHASAVDNSTFSSMRNVDGEPLRFLSQAVSDVEVADPHHRTVHLASESVPRLGQPRYARAEDFEAAMRLGSEWPRASWDSVSMMPSESYDRVVAAASGPQQFLTSDQCAPCHDAGGTGLQFDMTEPNPHGDGLIDLSPYALWRTSPMGLSGRDPIFFAQLASEVDTFHPATPDAPDMPAVIEDICLECHGILGQRQYTLDQFAETGSCGRFGRDDVAAVPWPDGNPTIPMAPYGALARDGISCTACHHTVLGRKATREAAKRPENHCVLEKQALLNPGLTGLAATFTGNYLVGPADAVIGPFDDPRTLPMEHALGITPVESDVIATPELCGSCHTVHLPVLYEGVTLANTYEQTTYPEWAFSSYRTGETPDGPLPGGAGDRAESCQGCHMPTEDDSGAPYVSKIATIEEHSTWPETDYRLGGDDIDLAAREGYGRHTLVGLNVFLIEMAQQFPDVLGIRTLAPMLGSRGEAPLVVTEQAMLDQASSGTAAVAVEVERDADALRSTVTVTSRTGHKLPSGVGFRRLFLTFEVLDARGRVLWASGRTDGAGVLVDATGAPIAGEHWWSDGCGERLPNAWQPHYQTVTAQDQAQIYQELVSAPASADPAACGGETDDPAGPLTTSFLSICQHVKDNRLLPHGFLPLEERLPIAKALGAEADLAEDVHPVGVGDDPDYVGGGGDSVVYAVPLDQLGAPPAAVRATLSYQAVPPYFLQDRFCTSRGADAQRLEFLSSHLELDDTPAAGWKLDIVSTGEVAVPAP